MNSNTPSTQLPENLERAIAAVYPDGDGPQTAEELRNVDGAARVSIINARLFTQKN